jgi:hypothetical protein
MLWIGAIFGALFGWIGILVAALFWATLAIIKLIWALTLFAFQALLWVGAFIYKGIEYLVNRQSNTTKVTPPALTPKRTFTRFEPRLTPSDALRKRYHDAGLNLMSYDQRWGRFSLELNDIIKEAYENHIKE